MKVWKFVITLVVGMVIGASIYKICVPGGSYEQGYVDMGNRCTAILKSLGSPP